AGPPESSPASCGPSTTPSPPAGPLRERGGPAGGEGVVEGPQLAGEDPGGPAGADAVVLGGAQQPALLSEPQQGGAQARPPAPGDPGTRAAAGPGRAAATPSGTPARCATGPGPLPPRAPPRPPAPARRPWAARTAGATAARSRRPPAPARSPGWPAGSGRRG